MSDDGVDISVGHAGAEHADTCGWCAYADMRMMHADAFRMTKQKNLLARPNICYIFDKQRIPGYQI